MILYCIECGSDKVENKELQLCASCAHSHRKAERMKLNTPKPIKKVSNKRGKELEQYAKLRDKFLLNKWCAYHGNPCIPTDVHHQKGRVGFADDKQIPLLIDKRYWIPVCRQAHYWITEHSKEAIEQGYSYPRTI